MTGGRGWTVVVLILAAAGCGGKSADQWLKEKLVPVPTAVRIAQIESPHPDVRREALQAVAADRQARTIPSVVKVFCLVAKIDADPMVRAAAVRGLADMQGEGVVETLAEVVGGDKSEFVRRDAIAALARRSPPEGAAAIIAALKGDPSIDVRIEAAAALRLFRDLAAAQALAEEVEDSNIAIAFRAWEGLRYMTGQDLPRQRQPWADFLVSTAEPFALYGKPPPLPKGVSQRPQFKKGARDFFKDMFRKDVREAELE